jgi:hypothetical protein
MQIRSVPVEPKPYRLPQSINGRQLKLTTNALIEIGLGFQTKISTHTRFSTGIPLPIPICAVK